MQLPDKTRLGSYEILGLLGAGGMGEVYHGRDLKLHRDVAIKILPAAFSQDSERVSRFQREAQILASINHSNIAAIHDVLEAAGTHFLVLELVQGETFPVWSQDGANIAFRSVVSDSFEIVGVPADKTREPERFISRPYTLVPTSWHPKNVLAFTEIHDSIKRSDARIRRYTRRQTVRPHAAVS